jgi:CBS domain-containing protein
MKIDEILRQKGHHVLTITEERSVLAAAKMLTEHNVGSLVVARAGEVVGIITERDILRLTASAPGKLHRMPVGDNMTRDPVIAGSDDDLRKAMAVMTEHRIRHLPVQERGQLVGLVSIGDLIKACLDLAEDEIVHLRQYIHGGGAW